MRSSTSSSEILIHLLAIALGFLLSHGTNQLLRPDQDPTLRQRYRDQLGESILGWWRGERTPTSTAGSFHQHMLLDLGGIVRHVARADVLLVGNSRMAAAIDHQGLEEFTRRTGVRVYNLATGPREGQRFVERMIRRFQLRPRWVVVNVDEFFVEGLSDRAREALDGGRWGAFQSGLDDLGSTLGRLLQYSIPSANLPADLSTPRWCQDGTLTDNRLTEERASGGPIPVLEKGEWMEPFPAQLARAKEFQALLTDHGTRLVLTHVPHSEWDSIAFEGLASKLGKDLGVPVLLPRVAGLETYDGSHLTTPSARRFTQAFLRNLEGLEAGD